MKENWAQSDYLNGRVVLSQPTDGYRAGLDAVMLAAAVNPQKGERALDVGCGIGTVMLCSSWRNPDAYYTGIEVQNKLVECADHNIVANKKAKSCQVIHTCISGENIPLDHQSFDHVFTNPPYYKERASRKSPFETKARAHVEEISLESWIVFCLKMLKSKGTFTMIYPTERLDEILSCLQEKVGELLLFPLWSKKGEPAKRIIIQGRKQIRTGLKLLPGLVLHKGDGDNTDEAIQVLRNGDVLF